jgi:uncharacterized protein (DUF1015 family)
LHIIESNRLIRYLFKSIGGREQTAMTVIRPFRGLFYNLKLVDSLDRVITPPYDVLSAADQKRLHDISPYNIVRLEQGLIFPDDNDLNNRYSRAAKTMDQWLTDGILTKDQDKSFYLYEQSFTYQKVKYRRKGIITALMLEPYCNGNIFPHEKTMSAPKADRLALLKHLRANISPVFMLMTDPANHINQLFENYATEEPIIEVVENNGQKHRIWKLTNPDGHRHLIDYAGTQKLLIADGHHRYETALEYKEIISAKEHDSSAYIMSTVVSVNDPGLLMLPTHRLLSNLNSEQQRLLKQLINSEFDQVSCGKPDALNEILYMKALTKSSAEKKGFGILTGTEASILVSRNNNKNDLLPVELLHRNILEPFISLQKSNANLKEIISYPHDFTETFLNVIHPNSNSIAFILANIPVSEIYNRARSGGVMPQKTTFFYPKLPGGLVLRSFDLD